MTDNLSRLRRYSLTALVAFLLVVLAVPGVARAGDDGSDPQPPGPTEPTLALTGSPRDADPCPLIDTAVLRPFGSVRIAPSYLLPACDARVDAPDGARTRVTVGFESPDDAGLPAGPSLPAGRLTVVRGGQYDTDGRLRCDTVVLLPDRTRARVSSSEVSGRPSSLCSTTDVTTVGVVDRLIDDGISYAPGRTDTYGHSRADACALLGDAELSAVSGLDRARPEPRFAAWGCGWGRPAYGRPHVDLSLRLDDPEYATYGRPNTVAGKPAFTDPRPGFYNPSRCTGYVVHEQATSAQDQTEIVSVTVDAPGAEPDLCRQALALATDADRRLSTG